jgi:hypothetical protein
MPTVELGNTHSDPMQLNVTSRCNHHMQSTNFARRYIESTLFNKYGNLSRMKPVMVVPGSVATMITTMAMMLQEHANAVARQIAP